MKAELLTLVLSVPAMLLAASPSGQENYQRHIQEQQAKGAAALGRLMDRATNLEVCTLDPRSGWEKDEIIKSDSDRRLGRWKIIDRMEVASPTEIKLLRSGLEQSIRESDGSVASCFEPRHGLRFRDQEREISIIVCFACRNLRVEGASDFSGAAINSAAAPAFYAILRARGLTNRTRLKTGTSDEKLANLLVGEWANEGKITADSRGVKTRLSDSEAFSRDGSFSTKHEFFMVVEGGTEQLLRTSIEFGRWRVQDGILFRNVRQKRFKTDQGEEEMSDVGENGDAIMAVSDRELSLVATETIMGAEFVLHRK